MQDFKSFLFQELGALAATFPAVTVRYGYDVLADSHIVEITPLAQYAKNDDLYERRISIMERALELHPEQSLTFISNDSLLAQASAERTWNAKGEKMFWSFYEHLVQQATANFRFDDTRIGANIIQEGNTVLSITGVPHYGGNISGSNFFSSPGIRSACNIISMPSPASAMDAQAA